MPPPNRTNSYEKRMKNETKKTLLAAALIVGGVAAAAGATGFFFALKRRKRGEKILDVVERDEVKSRKPTPGDILLFHNARGANNLIGWLTGSPFYHVGLYAGDEMVVESRTQGVVHDTLRDRQKDYVALPAPGGSGQKALAWAKTQIGDSYDDFDLGVIALERVFKTLRLNYTRPGRYTCGEFVAMAFEEAGQRLFPDRDTAAVVPGDFGRLLPTDALPEH